MAELLRNHIFSHARTCAAVVLTAGALVYIESVYSRGVPPEDSKAIRTSVKVMEEAGTRVRASCGNPKLLWKVSWQDFDELDYESGGMSKTKALGKAGDRANVIADSLISLCTNVVDVARYRNPAAQITEIDLSPSPDARDFRFDVKREGSALKIRFGAFGVSETQDVVAELKRVF